MSFAVEQSQSLSGPVGVSRSSISGASIHEVPSNTPRSMQCLTCGKHFLKVKIAAHQVSCIKNACRRHSSASMLLPSVSPHRSLTTLQPTEDLQKRYSYGGHENHDYDDDDDGTTVSPCVHCKNNMLS